MAWNDVASKAIGGLKTGGQIEGYSGPQSVPYSYHKGGKVKKTGLARLKKGERVLTKSQQKRLLKKRGK